MTLSKKSWLVLALAALLLVCGFARGASAYTGYPWERYAWDPYCYPNDPGYYWPDRYYSMPNRYEISPESGSYNGTGDLRFRIELHPKYLMGVSVDSSSLREGRDYSVSALQLDRTLLTFHESFLQGLGEGVHRVFINFSQAELRTYINVNPNPYSPGRTYRNDSGYLYSYNPDYDASRLAAGDAVALRDITVYEEPSSKSDKLGNYASGTGMHVTGFTSSGTYAIVRFGSDVGYVRADYIRVDVKGAYTGFTSTKAYLFYTARSTSSGDRYAQVEKDATLTLLARDGSYWKVDFGGEIVYIQAKNVKNITVG